MSQLSIRFALAAVAALLALACSAVNHGAESAPKSASRGAQAAPESAPESARREAPAPAPGTSSSQPMEPQPAIAFQWSAEPFAQELTAAGESPLEARVLSLPASENTWIALDAHPPRKVGARQLRVVDLLNEDEEMAPGFHFVTLFQRKTSRQMTVRTVGFIYESGEPATRQLPPCVLFTESSTLNGMAARDSLVLLAVPLRPGPVTVKYSASGRSAFRSEGEVAVGVPVLVRSPPSGDIQVSADCLGLGSTAVSVRTLTVNADAEGTTP